MPSFALLCYMLLVSGFLQRVRCFNLLSSHPNTRVINVNVRGDGYFIVNQVGDSQLPTSPPDSQVLTSPDSSMYIEVEQHSNYLEDLYAMNRLQRDRKILEDLKQIIKESGKMKRNVIPSAQTRNGQPNSSEDSRIAEETPFLPRGRRREKPKNSDQYQHTQRWERGSRGRRN